MKGMRGPQGLVCEAGRPLMWPEGVSADFCASISIHEWTEKEREDLKGKKKKQGETYTKKKLYGGLRECCGAL